MRAGRWRLTHQGVAVGADGNLYDGQHRLSAITRAGVAVRMLVVRGLEPQAREEIDTGEKRTAADNFSIVDGEALNIQHAAILNALYRLTRDASLASRAVSVAELRASHKAFSEPLKALCAGRANSVKGVSRAYVLAAFVLAWRSNPETVTTCSRAPTSPTATPSSRCATASSGALAEAARVPIASQTPSDAVMP